MHLSDDSAGASRRVEGLGILVVKPNVILDGFDRVTNAAECPITNLLPCDFGKPAFDLVEPGRTGRCEVRVIARSCGQPVFHCGMLVGAIVIQDQMDLQIRLNGLVDPVEKSQKLLIPVPRQTFADHGPFEHIQRGKQRRRPLALIIMRSPCRQART